MASVLDVAKYIREKLGGMTSMKLQKLVFYCQAWSLAWDDVPLFDEDFEAWANGPVCPALYSCHRGMFAIPADFFADRPSFAFTGNQRETMDLVLEHYGNKEPYWLSELTHQEAPWMDARVGIPEGIQSDRVITKEAMQQYYGGLV